VPLRVGKTSSFSPFSARPWVLRCISAKANDCGSGTVLRLRLVFGVPHGAYRLLEHAEQDDGTIGRRRESFAALADTSFLISSASHLLLPASCLAQLALLFRVGKYSHVNSVLKGSIGAARQVPESASVLYQRGITMASTW